MLPRSKLLDAVKGGMHALLLLNGEPDRPWNGVGQLTVNDTREAGSILPMPD